MQLRLVWLAGLALLMASCVTNTTEIINENAIITGNEAPPYAGISTLQVETYINKVYIDLIGLEPSAQELQDRVADLLQDNLGEAARLQMIEELQTETAYFNQLFNMASADMLGGATESDVLQEYNTYLFFLQQALVTGDTLGAYFFEWQANRYAQLLTVKNQLQDGTATISDFYAAFVDNDIYDNINMGSENFVLACFENLLGRQPTQSELANGVTMVDGFPSNVLLRDGKSKLDFIDILTNSNAFFERLVIKTYQQLLVREPLPGEKAPAIINLAQSRNLAELQASLLKTDEYAGFTK